MGYPTDWPVGEIRSLLWQDVDLEGRAIQLSRQKSKKNRGAP